MTNCYQKFHPLNKIEGTHPILSIYFWVDITTTRFQTGIIWAPAGFDSIEKSVISSQ